MTRVLPLLLLVACAGGSDTGADPGNQEPDPALVFANCDAEWTYRGQDGALQWTALAHFDNAGLETDVESYDADGAYLSATAFTYRDDAQLLRIRSEDADHAETVRSEYGYEGDRNTTIDSYYTGVPSSRTTRVWDGGDDGPSHDDYDAGPDGTIDATTSYVYEDGHTAQAATDAPLDGTIDSLTTWTWEGGVVVRLAIDSDANGTIDATSDYDHDADGRVVHVESRDETGATSTTDVVWDCP